MGHVGAPNAIARYTEPNSGPSPSQREREAWLVWRADKLREMDDADYWRYALAKDKAFRAETEAAWRREWENECANERMQRGGKVAAIGGRA